jgi:hypothetical protein
MEKTFPGIAYRQAQNPAAPWLVSFVATAEDISSWSGIPRRSEKGLVGFQRPDDGARVDRARDFFKELNNQSPTALILGVHKVSDDNRRRVILTFLDGNDTSSIRRCELKVAFDSSNFTLADAVEELRSQIDLRLKEATPEDSEDPEEESEEDDDETEDGEDGDDGADGEIELGRSLLLDLSRKLDDSSWCDENKDDLADLAKPCTVIDGQHRLKGAKVCERQIPFAVIAIYDCPWPEQVFQFTVVNYTAKGIPDQFITANAALSLTGDELEMLKNRLTQAKIKVTEYELMRVVNFDANSPFYQKVSMASKGPEAGKIGYKTMVQVAKAWHSGKNSAVKQIVANIYPDILGKASAVKRERLARWMADDWGVFFIDFWRTVYQHYKNAAPAGFDPWGIGSSNLTLAVTLLELQQAFFINLAQQDEEFFEVDPSRAESPVDQLRDKVRKRAEKVASFIPVAFFQANWKMKSLNTGPGRVAIQTALKAFVENKGNYQYDKSSLVTGKTS